MKLILRGQWGARPARRRVRGSLKDKPTGHWNGPIIRIGGASTWDHSRCASIVRGVQNYHMDKQKWSDIAYNFAICPHGYIFECRGLDIINGANGTTSGNRSSHALMFIAGKGNVFTPQEKVAFRECVSYIANHVGAADSAKGHRDHKSTECPGDERYAWIHKGMPLNGVPSTPKKDKDISMEAAIELVKMHYDNARGGGKGTYDVRNSDRRGYQHWITTLLDAHDKGLPLKPITDKLGAELYKEVQNRG